MRPFLLGGFEDLIRRFTPWIGLALVLGLAILVYRPGLSGGFLFDDFVNLDALGAAGPVDNWPVFWRYITSGTADPTGRPLALLSFLIDARDWPADPSIFLRNNLILHLLNGVLLFALLRRLGQLLKPGDQHSDASALLAAGLWLLHPLLVSTTLYAVQREAMLPATFTLLGLLTYLHGRSRFVETEGLVGTGWMVAGIGLGTALALASKGNGILLPLLAWVLEATVVDRGKTVSSDAETSRKLHRLKWLLLILPSLLLFAYLASKLRLLNVDLANRPWTVGERLLTEPRVLLDYLQLLFVPRSISTGLYNESYPVATDLWHPLTTVPALLLLCGLVYLSFRCRVRAPRVAAALLFFFAGHLLESTVIPLEIYFEHRNYLPALLLFWPLAHAICGWRTSKTLRATVALGLLGLFAFTTFQRAELWGQPDKLAALWSLQNPQSSRAQASAGISLIQQGAYQRAAEKLAPLWQQHPDDIQLAFNYINAACAWHGVTPAEKQALSFTLRRSATGGQLIHQWLGRAIDTAASDTCAGLSLADVESWIDVSAENPVISPAATRVRNIAPLEARLAIARGQPALALEHFNLALAAATTPDAAASYAALLASAGYYKQALAHLDYYEQIKSPRQGPKANMAWLHNRVLELQGYWPREMAILRAKLVAEIKAQDARPHMDSSPRP